jgi:hypothetical protein
MRSGRAATTRRQSSGLDAETALLQRGRGLVRVEPPLALGRRPQAGAAVGQREIEIGDERAGTRRDEPDLAGVQFALLEGEPDRQVGAREVGGDQVAVGRQSGEREGQPVVRRVDIRGLQHRARQRDLRPGQRLPVAQHHAGIDWQRGVVIVGNDRQGDRLVG